MSPVRSSASVVIAMHPIRHLPKAVFLDVGWTLLYPTQSMWEIFAELGRESGTELDALQIERLVHDLMVGSREHALAQLQNGARYSDSDPEFAAQFGSMVQFLFGSGQAGLDLGVLTRRFLDRFWTQENWLVFSDVIEGLRKLRSMGLRLVVVSNAGSGLVGFLERRELLGMFDCVVVSAVEGVKKPDRRIFELALQRVGVGAHEAVHVGDMVIEDVVGAHGAGVRPLLMDRGNRSMFPNHSETSESLPPNVARVRTLDDVVAALQT